MEKVVSTAIVPGSAGVRLPRNSVDPVVVRTNDQTTGVRVFDGEREVGFLRAGDAALFAPETCEDGRLAWRNLTAERAARLAGLGVHEIAPQRT